jgi:hypothetical protein
MQIIVSQIGILLPSTLPRSLFRPTFSDKGSSNARGCEQGLELIPEENSHFIQVETGLLRQVVAEGFYHPRCYGPFPTDSREGSVNVSKLPQVSANIDDRKLAAFSFFCHFRCGEGLALYHITDEMKL